MSRTGTYPAADGTITAQVKTRVFRAIAEDVIPDPRDAIIIGLVNACDAFRFLLPTEEYEGAKERIELLSTMDLVTRTIATAVSESSIRLSSRAAAMTKPVPRVKLLRMIAKKSLRQGNLAQLVAELHEEYGSVFAIKPPFVKRGLTVLAGADANTWMNRKGRFHLRTKDLLSDWEKVYGASSCKGLMGSQVSQLAVGVDTSNYILDLVSYKERSLVTHMQRSLPKFMLKTPGMRRKRKKIFELFEIIQAAHAPGLRKEVARDFVDDMMSLHISDPQFLPETDLLFVFVTPMIASIYLGSALAFAIYSMVTHPDLHERVQAEADALFGNDDPGREDITMSSVVTHRLIMESHRLYPIIPVTMRHVMNTFVMDGYEIPVGTRVIIGKTASHYVDKHFRDPLKFDIDRYLPERGEHRKPGVYAPFGLGTHTCLGSRWVELQMVVSLLLIAHHFTIDLHPTDYRIGYNPFPTSSPNKSSGSRSSRSGTRWSGSGTRVSRSRQAPPRSGSSPSGARQRLGDGRCTVISEASYCAVARRLRIEPVRHVGLLAAVAKGQVHSAGCRLEHHARQRLGGHLCARLRVRADRVAAAVIGQEALRGADVDAAAVLAQQLAHALAAAEGRGLRVACLPVGGRQLGLQNVVGVPEEACAFA